MNLNDPKELEAFIRLVMEKADREIHRFGIASGTVVDAGVATTFRGQWVNVDLDEDNSGEVQQVAVAVGTALLPGDRVLVAFDPPHGGYVIGVINFSETEGQPCALASYRLGRIGDGSDVPDGVVELLSDGDDSLDSVNCGFTLTDSDGDGILDAVVIPEAGVYVIAASGTCGVGEMFDDDAAEVALEINGSAVQFSSAIGHTDTPGNGLLGSYAFSAFAANLAAGDTVRLFFHVITDTSVFNWHTEMVGNLTVWQSCCIVPTDLDESEVEEG